MCKHVQSKVQYTDIHSTYLTNKEKVLPEKLPTHQFLEIGRANLLLLAVHRAGAEDVSGAEERRLHGDQHPGVPQQGVPGQEDHAARVRHQPRPPRSLQEEEAGDGGG